MCDPESVLVGRYSPWETGTEADSERKKGARGRLVVVHKAATRGDTMPEPMKVRISGALIERIDALRGEGEARGFGLSSREAFVHGLLEEALDEREDIIRQADKHGEPTLALTQTERDAWRLRAFLAKHGGEVICNKGQLRKAAGLDGEVRVALRLVRGSAWMEQHGWTIPLVDQGPGHRQSTWRLRSNREQ
jgi:hypothetical protein